MLLVKYYAEDDQFFNWKGICLLEMHEIRWTKVENHAKQQYNTG